jgi:membrane dipeptidase
MKLRTLLFVIVLLVAGIIGFAEDTASLKDQKLLQRAQLIHQKALTLDTHVDIPGSKYGTGDLDPGINNPKLRCDLVKMKQGGLDGVFLAVFVGQRPLFDAEAYQKAYQKAIAQFTAIKSIFKKYPQRSEQAFSIADVNRIAKSGKRAIIIGMENGYPVGNDLKRLKEYYELGARYITLCHWDNNQICDAATAKGPKYNGLSEFGKKVVQEMNRLGMMLDCSHASEDTFFDLVKYSKAPIIASHSGCYALTPHKRNLTDEQLKALTKNGGVIQVVAVKSFIETQKHKDGVNAILKQLNLPDKNGLWGMSKEERITRKADLDLYKKRRAKMEKTIPDALLADYVNHIDHAVKVAGIDHVGIGTDFDGGGGVPGFMNHAQALNVTIELLKRGYSENDVIKIWGGNLMRVWKQVESIKK